MRHTPLILPTSSSLKQLFPFLPEVPATRLETERTQLLLQLTNIGFPSAALLSLSSFVFLVIVSCLIPNSRSLAHKDAKVHASIPSSIVPCPFIPLPFMPIPPVRAFMASPLLWPLGMSSSYSSFSCCAMAC
jgi:hypothetical protein